MSRRTKATFQDGTNTNYTYDTGNRITQVHEKNAGGTVTATITQACDSLDRLTQEVTAQGTVSYTCDADGNRIKTGGTFPPSNVLPALATTTYNLNNQSCLR
ncbi:MAG: hypothetical protein CAF42_012380 [Nitrospira sp. CG24B]|nr:MAG: hypothetical protein CAF42_012380 [Nitrospira sp. CG24B]